MNITDKEYSPMPTNKLPGQLKIDITYFHQVDLVEIERFFKNEIYGERAGFSIAHQYTAVWFYYKWRLVSSSTSFIVSARIDGVLVGVLSVSEQRLVTESGQTSIVKLITDILVASLFRRVGILSNMLNFLYQNRKDNYFCIPNNNSLPIFNKLGFSVKGKIAIRCTLTKLIALRETMEKNILTRADINRFEQCPFPIYTQLKAKKNNYIARIFEGKYIDACVILGRYDNQVNLPIMQDIPLTAIISKDIFPFSLSLPSKFLLGSGLYIVCREKSISFDNYSIISWDAL